ncbi:LOW QUALITY PROTEIN: hypothetical protein MAR_015370, partial [Mya arenaria]
MNLTRLSISLLSCVVKQMERCVHKHLYNCVTSNHLLTSFFIRVDPMVNQLVYIYNDIGKATDEGKQ